MRSLFSNAPKLTTTRSVKIRFQIRTLDVFTVPTWQEATLTGWGRDKNVPSRLRLFWQKVNSQAMLSLRRPGNRLHWRIRSCCILVELKRIDCISGAPGSGRVVAKILAACTAVHTFYYF